MADIALEGVTEAEAVLGVGGTTRNHRSQTLLKPFLEPLLFLWLLLK